MGIRMLLTSILVDAPLSLSIPRMEGAVRREREAEGTSEPMSYRMTRNYLNVIV